LLTKSNNIKLTTISKARITKNIAWLREKGIRVFLLGCEENQDAVLVLMLQPETALPYALE
jgi:hypothetical protein